MMGKKLLLMIAIALGIAVAVSSCEGDHKVVETAWTTLETDELQKH